MSNEEQPLTNPELDHQLMELLSMDEFTMQYMVAYQVFALEQAPLIAVFDESEDVPFARTHAERLRDYLRSRPGTDKFNALREEMKEHPKAMYTWMYGYFLELLRTDEEE